MKFEYLVLILLLSVGCADSPEFVEPVSVEEGVNLGLDEGEDDPDEEYSEYISSSPEREPPPPEVEPLKDDELGLDEVATQYFAAKSCLTFKSPGINSKGVVKQGQKLIIIGWTQIGESMDDDKTWGQLENGKWLHFSCIESVEP